MKTDILTVFDSLLQKSGTVFIIQKCPHISVYVMTSCYCKILHEMCHEMFFLKKDSKRPFQYEYEMEKFS